MREAGLQVYEDWLEISSAAWLPPIRNAGTVACGSHIDTVRNAGPYDGAVGNRHWCAAAGALKGRELPCHLEIVAFSDEEGVRFHSTYLGAATTAGKLSEAELAVKDG